MQSRRRAHVVEVRPSQPADRFYSEECCAWVAIDSDGRSFYASDEAGARQWADDYNHMRPHRTESTA
jgi:hypothetical protein